MIGILDVGSDPLELMYSIYLVAWGNVGIKFWVLIMVLMKRAHGALKSADKVNNNKKTEKNTSKLEK